VGKEILTYDDLLQIVQLIKSAEAFSEFHLKIGDIELDVRKANGASPPDAPAPPAASTPVSAAAAAPSLPPSQSAVPAPPAAASPAPARGSGRAVDVPPRSIAVKSPMVGTFYRAPEPGARPFVEVGQRVEADTIVCIIEVMKLMNSIPAGTSGIVRDVLVADAEPVDAGQVIIVIDPKSS